MTPRPRLAFCKTCNARERAIFGGRCIICENHPDAEPLADKPHAAEHLTP